MTFDEQVKSLMIEHKVNEEFAKMRNDMVWESMRKGDCTRDEAMLIIKDLNKEYSHQRRSFLALSELFEESMPELKENSQEFAEMLMKIYGWKKDSE